jgi:hypothetical protein
LLRESLEAVQQTAAAILGALRPRSQSLQWQRKLVPEKSRRSAKHSAIFLLPSQ